MTLDGFLFFHFPVFFAAYASVGVLGIAPNILRLSPSISKSSSQLYLIYCCYFAIVSHVYPSEFVSSIKAMALMALVCIGLFALMLKVNRLAGHQL